MTWRLWREGDRWGWSHRPWWKVAINTALRFVQPRGPGRKLVVFTRVDDSEETPTLPPRVVGYGLGRVMHLAIAALVLLGGCRCVAGYERTREQESCRAAGGRVEITYCPPMKAKHERRESHRLAYCDWLCVDVPPGSWR